MDRLVASPVFVLSSTRSGSTLLRCVLNSHPMVCAPHELHVTHLRVGTGSPYVRMSLDVLGLGVRQVDHLLWDRLFHWALARSGKTVFVDKTPDNVLVWEQLAEAWPGARFVFLLRHPANILASAVEAGRDRDERELTAQIVRQLTRLDHARQTLPGLTVRYEDLTAQPETAIQNLCAFLDVPWVPQMLDYGDLDHGPFLYGIGDWGDKIRSGHITDGRPLPEPDEIPDVLMPFCRSWGYLDPTPTSDGPDPTHHPA